VLKDWTNDWPIPYFDFSSFIVWLDGVLGSLMDISVMYSVAIPVTGRVTMNIAMCKLYVRQGKLVVFATKDQLKTIAMLRPHFTRGTLFELVETWGVRVHERNFK